MKTLIVTTLIDSGNHNFNRYLQPCLKLIDGYLKYTDFNILILTNKTNSLSEIVDKRVSVVDYDKNFSEPVLSGKKFNMHIKRLAIKLGVDLDYDIIYHHDCDCYIVGWDQESYLNLISQSYDIIFPNSSRPQLGGLRKAYKHFQDKIDLEYKELYQDDFDLAPNASETFVLFKNNNKLKSFLGFWDKIAERNKDFNTYHSAVYFGTSAIFAKMNISEVTDKMKFSKFGRIDHVNRILNYHGVTIENK